MIIFEKIDSGDKVFIDRKTGGKYYKEKLQALINSSDMGVNSDRGQDFSWRLAPEQKAIINSWKQDPLKIDEVSTYTKVPVESLMDSDFLSFLVRMDELADGADVEVDKGKSDAEEDYRRRVKAAQERASQVLEPETLETPTLDEPEVETLEPPIEVAPVEAPAPRKRASRKKK